MIRCQGEWSQNSGGHFEKGLSQKNVKSITFTFVSQFGANFEINFLIVY